MFCKICGGDQKSWIQRSPDGNSCCALCGHIGPHTDWAKQKLIPEINKETFLYVIEQWQFSWMDVKGTDKQDAKNYFRKASGIDANMRYDLAKRLADFFNKKEPSKELIKERD